MPFPARSMGLAGACTQSPLPALWGNLDAPGVHAGDEAMQEADIATELEHCRTGRSLASDVTTDLLDVADIRLGQEVDQDISDVPVGRRHGLQGDPVAGVVRQAAGHPGVDGQDPFHRAAFFSQAAMALSATACSLRPAARQYSRRALWVVAVTLMVFGLVINL